MYCCICGLGFNQCNKQTILEIINKRLKSFENLTDEQKKKLNKYKELYLELKKNKNINNFCNKTEWLNNFGVFIDKLSPNNFITFENGIDKFKNGFIVFNNNNYQGIVEVFPHFNSFNQKQYGTTLKERGFMCHIICSNLLNTAFDSIQYKYTTKYSEYNKNSENEKYKNCVRTTIFKLLLDVNNLDKNNTKILPDGYLKNINYGNKYLPNKDNLIFPTILTLVNEPTYRTDSPLNKNQNRKRIDNIIEQIIQIFKKKCLTDFI